jgi:hypothetical protein
MNYETYTMHNLRQKKKIVCFQIGCLGSIKPNHYKTKLKVMILDMINSQNYSLQIFLVQIEVFIYFSISFFKRSNDYTSNKTKIIL